MQISCPQVQVREELGYRDCRGACIAPAAIFLTLCAHRATVAIPSQVLKIPTTRMLLQAVRPDSSIRLWQRLASLLLRALAPEWRIKGTLQTPATVGIPTPAFMEQLPSTAHHPSKALALVQIPRCALPPSQEEMLTMATMAASDQDQWQMSKASTVWKKLSRTRKA